MIEANLIRKAENISKVRKIQNNDNPRVPYKNNGFTESNLIALQAKYALELSCPKTKHKMQHCGVCDYCKVAACKICVVCKNQEEGSNTMKEKCRVQKCDDGYVTGCPS